MTEPAETTKLAVEGVQVDSPMEAQVQKLAEKVWSEFSCHPSIKYQYKSVTFDDIPTREH